mgnify:CR=1 FL=1
MDTVEGKKGGKVFLTILISFFYHLFLEQNEHCNIIYF